MTGTGPGAERDDAPDLTLSAPGMGLTMKIANLSRSDKTGLILIGIFDLGLAFAAFFIFALGMSAPVAAGDVTASAIVVIALVAFAVLLVLSMLFIWALLRMASSLVGWEFE